MGRTEVEGEAHIPSSDELKAMPREELETAYIEALRRSRQSDIERFSEGLRSMSVEQLEARLEMERAKVRSLDARLDSLTGFKGNSNGS